MEFVLGQRWVSQTESELGLGIVVGVEGRHVTLRFPVAEEDRVYALNNAPLARIVYAVGEVVHTAEQQPVTVEQVDHLDGLLVYSGRNAENQIVKLPETQISGVVQLSSPKQRLLSGQFDKADQYTLRVASLVHQHQLQSSPARGLLGPRTSLLAHQIYIAHEVARRYAPRVLLADEVGLGKTIEAGLIMHHQLLSGLASRVLIVVPDALLHQWLVEMLRKFGLRFSLFDTPRLEALLDSEEGNPFETEQLVLCGLRTLTSDTRMSDLATQAGWDLLVVDEAHHLQWQPEQPSNEYQKIADLAQVCPGLLLLTATPEQLGVESHYARLRLLDPSRFADMQTFIEEQAGYGALNDVVRHLHSGDVLPAAQRDLLRSMASIDYSEDMATDELIAQLLDRHGTGRVLFRNTRSAIAGFVQRIVHDYPLQVPGDDPTAPNLMDLPAQQVIGMTQEDGLRYDPRVVWLESFLQKNRQTKVLLICALAQTAIELERHLHLNVGIRSAAFYEDLSIVERDRAAAYFADQEVGAQVLICSEIGSEGRNFQFAHHLILFDLPLNPDLLEQRIGRLDRIGQFEDVQIHVPYVQNSAQHTLFRWYNEGLNLFTQSFSGGGAVMQEFGEALQSHMGDHGVVDADGLTALIEDTRVFTTALRENLQNGRDQLLELNSCKPAVAQQVIDLICEADADAHLQSYITAACDTFGVEVEPHSEHALILRPTEHMLTHSFPLLVDEGITVTFDRPKALVREDMEFLTWESPIVSGVMEMVLGSELGNTNMATMKLKPLPPGTLLVECYFAMHCSAPKKLQLGRFLPATPVRILLDNSNRDLTDVVTHEQLNVLCQHVKKVMRPAILKEIRAPLSDLLVQTQQRTQPREEELKAAAVERAESILGAEISRLQQLQKVNPAIRQEEIAFFVDQKEQVLKHVAQASLEPQAARVIITT
ncbi:MAG: RNA polymerase-associated protein RapA [bacterium]